MSHCVTLVVQSTHLDRPTAKRHSTTCALCERTSRELPCPHTAVLRATTGIGARGHRLPAPRMRLGFNSLGSP